MRPRPLFGTSALTTDPWFGRSWLRYGIRIDDAMPDELKRYRRRIALNVLAQAAFDLSIMEDLHAVGPLFVHEDRETSQWVDATVAEYMVMVVGRQDQSLWTPSSEELLHLFDGRWNRLPKDFYRSLMEGDE